VKRGSRWWWLFLLLPWLAVAATPDVTLPDIDGNSHRVSEFIGHGQWTVVAVWSVDCVICRRETPQLAFFHDDHKHKDARVLGIAIDGFGERARIRAFVDERGLSFPNLIGKRTDLFRFGTVFMGTPSYLFFSPTGELARSHVGSMTLAEVERTVEQLNANAKR